MALRTPTKDAEDIKIKYGCALRQLANDAPIEVPGVGERSARMLSRQTLAEVIEPRVEELYSLVQQELRRSGFEDLLSSGIVITGGSSAMQGMVELGEEIFHMPVRMGVPRNIGGLVRRRQDTALCNRRRPVAVRAGATQARRGVARQFGFVRRCDGEYEDVVSTQFLIVLVKGRFAI